EPGSAHRRQGSSRLLSWSRRPRARFDARCRSLFGLYPHVEELRPAPQLHAGPPERLSCAPLDGVDRAPAVELDVLDALVREERGEVAALGAQLAVACVGQQQLDGLAGVLLVRADHAA